MSVYAQSNLTFSRNMGYPKLMPAHFSKMATYLKNSIESVISIGAKSAALLAAVYTAALAGSGRTH